MYPIEIVAPMTRELTESGVESLLTPTEVDNVLGNADGSVLLVINSVCGCAAANARPAVRMALMNDNLPDEMYTVFAGVHKEATAKAREYLLPYPPSSPSIALFKNGRLVHMIERHHIEGRSAPMIAENLKAAFDHYCESES